MCAVHEHVRVNQSVSTCVCCYHKRKFVHPCLCTQRSAICFPSGIANTPSPQRDISQWTLPTCFAKQAICLARQGMTVFVCAHVCVHALSVFTPICLKKGSMCDSAQQMGAFWCKRSKLDAFFSNQMADLKIYWTNLVIFIQYSVRASLCVNFACSLKKCIQLIKSWNNSNNI